MLSDLIQPPRNLLTRRDGGRPVRHLRNAARAPTHVEVTKDRPGLTQAAAPCGFVEHSCAE
jgi:hypothetical protein